LIHGLTVLALQSDEIPIINFTLRVDAGRNRNSSVNPATAGLVANMLSKGTQDKTNAELWAAIGALGSTISINAGDTGVFASGTTLSENFNETMSLVQEMLFKPRWDKEEYATLKNLIEQNIKTAEGNPNAIARRELAKIRYTQYSPLHTSGATGYGSVEAHSKLTPVEDAKVYFYDVPGAKQSVKAYTYGIRSGFNGGKENGTFAVSSSVRSNVTKESLELIRNILANHGPETTEVWLRARFPRAKCQSDQCHDLRRLQTYRSRTYSARCDAISDRRRC